MADFVIGAASGAVITAGAIFFWVCRVVGRDGELTIREKIDA